MFTSMRKQDTLGPTMAQRSANADPPMPRIVTVTGLKKSGKTTVVESLIAELRQRGLRVGSIKSMQHGTLALEPEATDTRRHLQAGAEAVVALTATETAVFARANPHLSIDDALALLPHGLDLVICEGLLAGYEPRAVVLCLRAAEDFEEALRVRGIDRAAVIAVSGVVAGSRDAAQAAGRVPETISVFDAFDPEERRRLADRVLSMAAAGSEK
jgi:molybdopterin-guanine dinucleotide biosynthesis protein MobB